MQTTDKFIGSDDVVAREIGGEMVLLDLASGQYFGLDPVGGRVWQLLADDALTLEQICGAIEEEFDAPRATIETDVTALATDLLEKKLIRQIAS